MPNEERQFEFDVFVSHASEDKGYVIPLVQALQQAGVRVWFDAVSIDWGDDLRSALDRGLLSCRYGIVVFSKAFLARKKWTEYELNALLALETAEVKRILPIWHGIHHSDLLQYSPAFADRLAKVSSSDSNSDIVQSLLLLLRPTVAAEAQNVLKPATAPTPSEKISDLTLGQEYYLLCYQAAESEISLTEHLAGKRRMLEWIGMQASAVAELALTGNLSLTHEIKIVNRTMPGHPDLDYALAVLMANKWSGTQFGAIPIRTLENYEARVATSLEDRGILGRGSKTGMFSWHTTRQLLAVNRRDELKRVISEQIRSGHISTHVAVLLELAFSCAYGRCLKEDGLRESQIMAALESTEEHPVAAAIGRMVRNQISTMEEDRANDMSGYAS